MSIYVDRYRARGIGTTVIGVTTVAYRVSATYGWGEVNFRMCSLWRPDNRYPGCVAVRRHESGGLELSFDALRHGAKPRPPVIVAPHHVRKFILSCLECSTPDEPDNESGPLESGPLA